VTTASAPPHSLHQPLTFRTRGVAVPFTTPFLASARARKPSRGGIELIVPNPSGGPGTYVLDWSGVRALSRPTVHDAMLQQRLTEAPAIDPRLVRDAALAIALEGYAGHQAQAAARAARAADQRQRARSHFLLLRGLVLQIEPKRAIEAAERTPEFDRAAGTVLQLLVTDLRQPATQLASGVATLADAFAAVGIDPDDRVARIPRLVEQLAATASDLLAWARAVPREGTALLASAVAACMQAAAQGGTAVLATTRAVLADPLALLRRRLREPAAIQALAERGDWLLDGWERACLIWRATPAAARQDALQEIALALPQLPPEAHDWRDPSVTLPASEQTVRAIANDGSWQAGITTLRLTERNETLRAMSQ